MMTRTPMPFLLGRLLLLGWLVFPARPASVWAAAAGRSVGRPESGLTERAMGILQANCLSCHGEEKQRGGLQLQTRELALRGGDSGPVLQPGRPEQSRLLQLLVAEADPHMPPKKQLGTNQIQALRRWIAAGATWDEKRLVRADAQRPVELQPLPAGYQPVFAVAWSPDGKRLAVGRGSRLVLHEVQGTNFSIVRDIAAHGEVVRALAWSPDGHSLASGSFREIKVWQAETMEMAWGVTSNLLGAVTALRFTPSGESLVAAEGGAAEPGRLHWFRTDGGPEARSWVAHADTIYDLAFAPDALHLASAGADKLVRVWSVKEGKETGALEHAAAVFGVRFGTNQNEVVTVSADRQLKVWDLSTRESTVTINAKKHAFNAVDWSADGRWVVAGDEGGGLVSYSDFKRHSGAQSSDTGTERKLGRWAEPMQSVAISRDGKLVAAGAQDGTVQVVKMEGKALARLDPAPTMVEVPGRPGASTPSFVRDVLPILARSGCMAGSCHAKAEGQNGFKLSVFSFDPKGDFSEIVKEGRGRRVFPAAPAESLLLRKATASVEHGGGERFEVGSPPYRVLVDWIRSGLVYQHAGEPELVGISVEPAEKTYRRRSGQSLKVRARYSDGAQRDVTALADFIANDKEIAQVDESGLVRAGSLAGESVIIARYMGFVAASRVTVPAEKSLPARRFRTLPVSNFLDELAYQRFQKLGLFPSEPCTDAEFLRRVSLDVIGVLPTPAESGEFLADTNLDKRARLLDRLLEHPAYGDYWANKWADLLRPNPDRAGVKSIFVLDQWLREQFRRNVPYDQFVREILLAEGSNHRDGPAVIYRDRREPAELSTMFSQLFLGTRMECAKCHHHPNEKWSQADFYQFAAFFGPVKQKGAGLSPPISGGTETFYFSPGRTVTHPVTEEVMMPRPPDGPALAVATNSDPRRALAEWMTDPKNPFFAKAVVNRVWANFFGRGFVQPVDDFRVSNPAVHEPMLEALAADFVKHGYDLKQLMRTIVSSRLYQLGSQTNAFNATDTRNFSRSYRRRLPAEVLLDAVSDVTGVPDEFNGCPPGTRALQTWSYKVRSQFLDAFGRPNSSSDCPCEREARGSVVQALHMMNSRALQAKLSHPEGRARRLAAASLPPAEIVRELYLAAFCRPPTPQETELAAAAFAAPGVSRQTAAEDVLWALLNSPEFVFNH